MRSPLDALVRISLEDGTGTIVETYNEIRTAYGTYLADQVERAMRTHLPLD